MDNDKQDQLSKCLDLICSEDQKSKDLGYLLGFELLGLSKQYLAFKAGLIKFRSKDEEMFYTWCLEAMDHGIIERFEYEPETIQVLPKATTQRHKVLKTKTKIIDKFLLHSLDYTPDYYLWSKQDLESKGLVWSNIENGVYFYVIDVKGSFTKFNDGVKFSVIQKVLWHSIGMLSNKLECKKWFTKTFMPLPVKIKEDLLWTNGPHQRKRSTFKNCKTHEEHKKYHTANT